MEVKSVAVRPPKMNIERQRRAKVGMCVVERVNPSKVPARLSRVAKVSIVEVRSFRWA